MKFILDDRESKIKKDEIALEQRAAEWLLQHQQAKKIIDSDQEDLDNALVDVHMKEKDIAHDEDLLKQQHADIQAQRHDLSEEWDKFFEEQSQHHNSLNSHNHHTHNHSHLTPGPGNSSVASKGTGKGPGAGAAGGDNYGNNGNNGNNGSFGGAISKTAITSEIQTEFDKIDAGRQANQVEKRRLQVC